MAEKALSRNHLVGRCFQRKTKEGASVPCLFIPTGPEIVIQVRKEFRTRCPFIRLFVYCYARATHLVIVCFETQNTAG